MRPNTKTKAHRATAHRLHRNNERFLRRFRRGEPVIDIIASGIVAWAKMSYLDPAGTTVQPVIVLSTVGADGQLLVLRSTNQRSPELVTFDWRSANLPRRSWAHPLPVRINPSDIVSFAGRIDLSTIGGTPIGAPKTKCSARHAAVAA